MKSQIKGLTLFFMTALLDSGITAIPARSEIIWLQQMVPDSWKTIHEFLMQVEEALWSCPKLLFYGYDWLAFAHLVIALLFVGIFKNPVRNICVVDFGMKAYLLVVPFAFCMGHLRCIPFLWQLIDCSFGVFGLLSLWVLRKKILELEHYQSQEKSHISF